MNKTLLCFLLLLAAGLWSCRPADRKPSADGRPLLTASIAPLSYLVEQIAGPAYEVRTLMPAGSSPETYEPTPGQMVDVSESQAYFSVGTLGFETSLLQRLSESSPELRCILLFEGLKPLPQSHAHGANRYDPHVWTSPQNARLMARRICQELCELDSTQATAFRQRLTRFETRLDSLEQALRQRFAHVSARSFLIYHPSLAYFAQEFGLQQIPLEADGKEPSPSRLAALIQATREKARKGQVKLIFVQRENTGRSVQQVARQTGLHVVTIDPLSGQWMQQMDLISKSLAQ